MKYIKLFENWQSVYETFLSPEEHLNLVNSNPYYSKSEPLNFNSDDMEDDGSLCSKYIETSTDRFTKEETRKSKKNIIISNDGGKNGFAILVVGGNILIQVMQDGKKPCIRETWLREKKPELIFLFTESVGWMTGDYLEMIHKGGDNCNGLILLAPNTKERGLLQDYKIKALRVYTSEGMSGQIGSSSYVEADFTPENQEEFMNVLKCMWG